jgi:hypothetical protein
MESSFWKRAGPVVRLNEYMHIHIHILRLSFDACQYICEFRKLTFIKSIFSDTHFMFN